MSDSREPRRAAAAPEFDLTLCEKEPIHIPGAIQPHGALLAATSDGGLVTHASANLLAVLGRGAEAVLGRPLEWAIGEAAGRLFESAQSPDLTALGQGTGLSGPDGSPLHLHFYRSGRRVCLDIEPLRTKPGQLPPVTIAQPVLETFKHASTQEELCELAVRGLKAITGYDRVIAYRFASEGHGEVIAEARETHLDPYLGLRYPAADVPLPARRQYLRQRVGAIADSSYRPVPVICDAALDDGAPLDLTHSTLRSVSPIHLKYMRNMNTAASLTIGLAHRQTLWGMLVCHHATPKVPGPEIRAVADLIGQVVALLLGSLGEAQILAKRLERSALLDALVDRLASSVPLPEALAGAETELLQLVDAAGVVIRLSGTLLYLGRTPPAPAVDSALAFLQQSAGGAALGVDDLGLRHPELASCTAEGSGALLLPLAEGADDVILWFRPELSRTVTWGGNPAEHATWDASIDKLSPRASFAAWNETVSGRSAPWTEADLALAGELRAAIGTEMAQRMKAELARLRHYDLLTGLPNRSLLQDRLAQAELEPETPAALLFLDLDRFKAVNDTMGHAAGDALLVEVARRLLAAAGPENLAARLGGDEFVVLCLGLNREAVAELGERIRKAIEAPFEISGRWCHISASIGMAVADQSAGLDLVRAADMAMYVAKQGGGNRGTLFEPSLYDHAARQFELDQDLRAALGVNDQLVLFYQPMFGLSKEPFHLVGFEALLRWRHPRHGWLAPNVFIPMAERSGLINPLGDWVLAEAVRQGQVFREACAGLELRLNVNVSVIQLAQPNFCSSLAQMLRSEAFAPAALCLEVTESVLSDVAVSYVLADIRKLGVRVAIDDFGTGYSSLSYLRRLPVDVVKLDRSFVEELSAGAHGVGFLGAVVALAHAAGMSVVQEGVETQAQLEMISAAKADVAQGFLLSLPLSAKDATELAMRMGSSPPSPSASSAPSSSAAGKRLDADPAKGGT